MCPLSPGYRRPLPLKMSTEVFTDRLRRKSARAHSLSDALVHLRLVSVLVDRVLYGKAIACFYFVLKRIEDDLEKLKVEEPRISEFVEKSRRLYRASAIEKDLVFFLGPTWHSIAAKSSKPYAEKYLNHIENSMPNRICLVIHAYTQFAAFASGGRILARKLLINTLFSADERGQHDIDSLPEGLHAFQYPQNKKVDDLKADMKAALNEVATHLSPQEQSWLMDEHAMVFSLNNGIINSFKVGFMPSAKAYTSWMYRKVSSVVYAKNVFITVVVLTAGVLITQMSTRRESRNSS